MTAITGNPKIYFVTGANDRYFLMCGILLQSLSEYFPSIPAFVMDFGFNEEQRRFFAAKGILLELPEELSKSDHPYKLKSSMGLFLREATGVPIWIDADIVAVRGAEKALCELVHFLTLEKKLVAIGTDAGPCKTLADFSHHFRTPKLDQAMRDDHTIGDARCFNAGLICFLEADLLDEWRWLSETFEGDICWEQNAFNVLCHAEMDKVHVLESSVWNAHSVLLDSIDSVDEQIRCAGQNCIFAHATSMSPAHIEEKNLTFLMDGYKFETFMKCFTNGLLLRAQKKFLSDFLGSNFSVLRDLGVFVAA